MTSKIRKQVESYVKSLKWTPKDFYWHHALAVRNFALLIRKRIGGDKDVVEASALLHDVGKAKLLAPGHEKMSAQLAKKLLMEIGFNKDKIVKIIECIEYENFNSLEARVLRSADNMSLIMDNSGGREWYFTNILKNDKRLIAEELHKSFSEIDFDFARELVEENYKKLLKSI